MLPFAGTRFQDTQSTRILCACQPQLPGKWGYIRGWQDDNHIYMQGMRQTYNKDMVPVLGQRNACLLFF